MDSNIKSNFQKRIEHLAITEGVFAVALDPIIVIDAHGIISRFNAAAEDLFGYEAEDVIGKNVSILVPSPHKEQHDSYLHNYLNAGEAHVIGKGRDILAQDRDGKLIPAYLSVTQVEVDGTPYFVGTVRDMTKQRANEDELKRVIQDMEMNRATIEKQAQDMVHLAEELHIEKERVEESKRIIEHQATHDALTGLGNRALLKNALPQLISDADGAGAKVGFVYIDLDNFKPVNDKLGHDAGDKLLCDVSEAILSKLSDKDEAIRLGGDEFAALVWLGDGTGRDELRAKAHEILDALQINVAGGGEIIETGASIGIAMYPEDGSDAEEILTAADHAMYEAKRGGKNRVA